MSQIRFVFAVLMTTTLLTGCTSTILSNERIASETGGVLGVSPEEITIQNRRTEMTNTYYTAVTKSGVKYACIINGGNILTAGMVNPPICNRNGKAPVVNPFQAISIKDEENTDSMSEAQGKEQSVKKVPEIRVAPNSGPYSAQTMVVIANKTALRKKPSNSSEILKKLNKGEVVNAVKEKDQWLIIELASGEVGWCHKSLLNQK